MAFPIKGRPRGVAGVFLTSAMAIGLIFPGGASASPGEVTSPGPLPLAVLQNLDSLSGSGMDPVLDPMGRVLTSIDVEPLQAGAVIRLRSDGALESTRTFFLESPDRLVMDLPGVESDLSGGRIDLGGNWVDAVRVGRHPDKLRVVIDAGDRADQFRDRRVETVSDGLFVFLGEGREAPTDGRGDGAFRLAQNEVGKSGATGSHTALDPWEEAEEQATKGGAEADPDDEAESPPPGDDARAVMGSSPKPATAREIFGVQFDRSPARDRIAILGDTPLDYHLFEPNDETLIVILSDAVLSGDSGERLTPELGGPVSQVTIFEQPDLSGDEVRVVIRRASGLDPEVRSRGSLVLVDFENAGAKATLPPALLPDPPSSGVEASAGAGAGEPEIHEVISATGSSETRSADRSVEDVFAAGAPGTASPGGLEESSFEMLGDGLQLEGKEYRGRKISLDMKDVPITDVLRLIADVSELNIIAGDEVQGSITLRLLDVPWDQALDVILVAKQLGFVRVGNVLRIAPAENLKAEEAVRLQERREKEQLEDLEVKLQPINYASVSDVSNLLSRLLSPRGTVNTDERTNTVIIKDIPNVLAEAAALIEALDTPTPQVMIEAKIVEASLDFGRDLGSRWSVGVAPGPPPKTGGITWNGANSVAIENLPTSSATGALNMGFLLLNDQLSVDLTVNAMEQSGQGKVISSPRIVTLDNKEAIIEQGVTIPFQTFEGGDAALEFVDAVLSLKVTPHITPDQSIIMSVEVTRNAPDASVSTPTGSPAIAKNQAKTETLVMNGQTLVIGGIYTIDTNDTQTRVPYLHRIPVLGAAFRSRARSDSRKELLIFVTPRVVEVPGLSDR